MVWDTVHEVEVEIAQEVWEVILDHRNNAHRCMVVSLDSWWHCLSLKHVAFQEIEQVYKELFNLKPLLQVSVVNHACCALDVLEIHEL